MNFSNKLVDDVQLLRRCCEELHMRDITMRTSEWMVRSGVIWICVVLAGCVIQTYTDEQPETAAINGIVRPFPIVDGGTEASLDEADASTNGDKPDASEHDADNVHDADPQCAIDCDCNDNNVCTDDKCVDGACYYAQHNGGCGSTIGACRGTWCCTSEFTCFQAYDNDSDCATGP